MEPRKITIVETRGQRKSVIMSSATTLAELKSDLRANGIDYDGMTFFEGTSKVELKNDASVLPHDVPYRGTTTNELVFMLTNTNKKIKSGAMSRMEAYAKIKELGLQDECQKKFGKNFTMCKTADLISLVEGKSSSKPQPVKEAKPVEEQKSNDACSPAKSECCSCESPTVKAALHRLVEVLNDNGTLEDYESDDILNILDGNAKVSSEKYQPTSASSYSDDEIADMFAGMGV